ncbi:MAG: 8-oxo-dGTP diphosphatase [Patescibacteria group bacterium]|nr:8-oxo-dGTP diphosphatase [Patescibacteria group bacterium]
MKEEKVLLEATLCFLVRDDKVLLGKKMKKIGAGCWNGYGGGIEKTDSSVEEGALRELREETKGVIAKLKDLKKIAIVDFHNTMSDGREFVCTVHCFLVHDWKGDIQETDEMITPTWFNIGGLPLDEMMPADREWLPRALLGQKLHAKAYLSPFQQESTQPVQVEYVDSFSEKIHS